MAETFAVPHFAPLDVDFFNRILSDAGFQEAKVTGFSSSPIGTGQMGKCVRFELQFDGPINKSPKTLIGKFASDSKASLAAAASFSTYTREVAFYQHFLAGLSISAPQCFHAEIKDDVTAFMLVLADQTPAVQGDQLAGCTPEIALLAVLELVGLHAPSWNRVNIFPDHPNLQPNETAKRQGRTMYSSLVTPFSERFGSKLTEPQLAIIRAAGEYDAPLFTFEGQPTSLIHGDYRLDNLLLTQPPKPTICVVDWQTLTLGNPLADVAYLMATSLTSGERRTSEREILREYHQGMLAAGVWGFSWDDCWREYRRMSVFGFPITVVASMMVKRTKRGDEMFLRMARGCSQMALDLDVDEFLH